jgi:hypothetical protein
MIGHLNYSIQLLDVHKSIQSSNIMVISSWFGWFWGGTSSHPRVSKAGTIDKETGGFIFVLRHAQVQCFIDYISRFWFVKSDQNYMFYILTCSSYIYIIKFVIYSFVHLFITYIICISCIYILYIVNISIYCI